MPMANTCQRHGNSAVKVDGDGGESRPQWHSIPLYLGLLEKKLADIVVVMFESFDRIKPSVIFIASGVEGH
ncbi:hypothetical protein KIN20_000984 [Parelaphostrongylus tenuis]|uniref:Uncharacterized protein n=1 Tax=Parelaphostrongylus tenuis TaxID=148309 RepID=A0AAD5LSY4_PARTN|nr:hypothetical protein KIN20_000984 [Parelaphostrongylus tenuis]